MKYEGIVIHCSATKETSDFSLADLKRSHLARGWSDVGYHFYITKDGVVHRGRPIDRMGAHVRGFNRNTVGVCYEGGLDANGKAKDTRTMAQQSSMLTLLKSLTQVFPIEYIKGHRDYSPDLDGDGKIESHEWMKQCPCFDAIPEYKFLMHL